MSGLSVMMSKGERPAIISNIRTPSAHQSTLNPGGARAHQPVWGDSNPRGQSFLPVGLLTSRLGTPTWLGPGIWAVTWPCNHAWTSNHTHTHSYHIPTHILITHTHIKLSRWVGQHASLFLLV